MGRTIELPNRALLAVIEHDEVTASILLSKDEKETARLIKVAELHRIKLMREISAILRVGTNQQGGK